MTKKEKINIFITLATFFLMIGQFVIFMLMELCGITVIYNTGLAYIIGRVLYLAYAGFLMIYMIYFIGLEEKGKKLHFRKELVKQNIFAVIAMEMLLIMFTYFNYMVFRKDLTSFPGPFSPFTVYGIYILVMIVFALIAYILREKRRK